MVFPCYIFPFWKNYFFIFLILFSSTSSTIHSPIIPPYQSPSLRCSTPPLPSPPPSPSSPSASSPSSSPSPPPPSPSSPSSSSPPSPSSPPSTSHAFSSSSWLLRQLLLSAEQCASAHQSYTRHHQTPTTAAGVPTLLLPPPPPSTQLDFGIVGSATASVPCLVWFETPVGGKAIGPANRLVGVQALNLVRRNDAGKVEKEEEEEKRQGGEDHLH
eukprot:GHVS01096137.1.p1 GENE.GHVS01096137.1~~GHVS01096137.1.p1  ORF type:complete len:215 (-),score=113.31 GHVS01096137.1:131-775(-)